MVARNEDLIKTLQVMVVDDDPVFRHYLEAQLAMLGCQILPMDDAESAWDRIRTQPPDLVLSDVLMPGTSGVELCRRIKSTPGLEDLPVVLLTMTGSRSKDEGYRAGADDFLSKPPHLMELRTRLRNLLLLRSLQTASAPPPPEVAESIPAARTPRLVVLESQGILREYVRGTLAEEGLEVLGVDSVARFHELLGQSLPDLAILDQDLMEGTGSALVASLRARVATADLPVLLMCNPGDLDPGGGAWNADADEHLLKPFEPVELKARVHLMLKHADLQRRNDARRLDADPSALKDPRSGAYTGAFLYACLDSLVGLADLVGQPVGLLACELQSPVAARSHLLLREVAGGLRRFLEPREILCRVEEDLFVAVLPGVDLRGAVERARCSPRRCRRAASLPSQASGRPGPSCSSASGASSGARGARSRRGRDAIRKKDIRIQLIGKLYNGARASLIRSPPMKLSSRALYGVRAMLVLARAHGQGSMLLKEIAERGRLPGMYLEQLMVPLRKAGLVLAMRGAKGGYTLASAPAEISVLAILEALEGPLNLAECPSGPGCCGQPEACCLQEALAEGSRALRRVYQNLSLAAMLERQLTLESEPYLNYTI